MSYKRITSQLCFTRHFLTSHVNAFFIQYFKNVILLYNKVITVKWNT